MQSCQFVNESIRFDLNTICSCCNNVRGIYLSIDNKSNIDNLMQTFFEKTDKLANGILCDEAECEGCYKTTEEYISSHPNITADKIKMIYVCHWKHCNMDCIYCVFKNEKNNKNNYNVLPYLKWLKENNKLAEDFMLCTGGGEPGILKEIDKILDWGYKNTKSYISIMSNFVIFRNSYKKLLKKGQLLVNISIDSADRQLYKVIHNADYFNKVINNIKKAIKYAKNKNQIHLKYILLDNINDKKEYIDEFLKLSKELGVYMIHFDFDRSFNNINNTIPEKLLNLYDYAKKEAPKYDLFFDPDERAELMYVKKQYI